MAHAARFENDIPAPLGLQNFAHDEDRKRLTPAAVKAVLRLVAAWDGSNADGAALLGVSESSWDRMKAGRWDGTLSQDQLTRASALIGIFKGLHLLFATPWRIAGHVCPIAAPSSIASHPLRLW